MRIPITPLAIEVFGKAPLEPARRRPIVRGPGRDHEREARARPIAALLVAARLRAARV